MTHDSPARARAGSVQLVNRALSSFALILFACLMIGADDCALTQIGQPVPPTTPAKPYCLTDPPVGCAAVCAGVGVPALTDACSNIEAGPRTMQFKNDVQIYLDDVAANGGTPCPTENLGAAVTPCMDGIQPVEWPNQDHAECTTPPPGCPL